LRDGLSDKEGVKLVFDEDINNKTVSSIPDGLSARWRSGPLVIARRFARARRWLAA
jgi:hypothetical protein